MKKFLIFIAFIILLPTLFIGFFLLSIGNSLCDNEILDSSNSNSKKHSVILFNRNCGATSGYNKQISIIDFGNDLDDESGNIFIADNNHGKARSDDNGPFIDVKWLDNKSLKIIYTKNTRIFKKEIVFDSIKILYEEVD